MQSKRVFPGSVIYIFPNLVLYSSQDLVADCCQIYQIFFIWHSAIILMDGCTLFSWEPLEIAKYERYSSNRGPTV